MGEEKIFQLNDFYRAMGSAIEHLKAWESPLCNEEARQQILIKMKEAQFWALELVKEEC